MVSLQAIAQTNQAMSDFSVKQTKNSIHISWTIKAGYSCSDVNVEHATDSINFYSIFKYPGVCGGIIQDRTYNFLHENPMKNSKNYYRMNLGFFGHSEILPIHFSDYGIMGFSIQPNPIDGTGRIKFSNLEGASYNFEVFNSRGVLVEFQEIFNEEIEIKVSKFNSGIYFFRLYSNQYSFRGRFSVL